MGVRRLRLVLDRAITSCVAVSEDETLLLGRGLLICEDSKSNLSGLLWELHGIAALKTKIKIKLVHGKRSALSYEHSKVSEHDDLRLCRRRDTDAGLVKTAQSGQLGTPGASGHVLRVQPASSCPREQG